MASDIIVPDVVWQNVITHNRKQEKSNKPDTAKVTMPQVEIDEEVIPDSLLHPRWHIQRTTPITLDDLEQGSADLNRPDNLKQEVEYNDTLNRYVIGNKIGDSYISAPVMMTPEEYNAWSLKHSFADYYRAKNQEILKTQGKEKFDFTDMHFSLGPREDIRSRWRSHSHTRYCRAEVRSYFKEHRQPLTAHS